MSDEAEAMALFQRIRKEDTALSIIEGKAVRLVRELTCCDPVNVGSFGLFLNLPESDLDLSIGATEDTYDEIVERLRHAEGVRFKARRQTRLDTWRHVFDCRVDDVLVDLAVMKLEDLALLMPGLTRCRMTMSDNERAAHVYMKWKLRASGDASAYAEYKLGPYKRFCPGFCWLPLP